MVSNNQQDKFCSLAIAFSSDVQISTYEKIWFAMHFKVALLFEILYTSELNHEIKW